MGIIEEAEVNRNSIIVKSKVGSFVGDLHVAKDVYSALAEQVITILSKAVERAKSNNRKTVKAVDL